MVELAEQDLSGLLNLRVGVAALLTVVPIVTIVGFVGVAFECGAGSAGMRAEDETRLLRAWRDSHDG